MKRIQGKVEIIIIASYCYNDNDIIILSHDIMRQATLKFCMKRMKGKVGKYYIPCDNYNTT